MSRLSSSTTEDDYFSNHPSDDIPRAFSEYQRSIKDSPRDSRSSFDLARAFYATRSAVERRTQSERERAENTIDLTRDDGGPRLKLSQRAQAQQMRDYAVLAVETESDSEPLERQIQRDNSITQNVAQPSTASKRLITSKKSPRKNPQLDNRKALKPVPKANPRSKKQYRVHKQVEIEQPYQKDREISAEDRKRRRGRSNDRLIESLLSLRADLEMADSGGMTTRAMARYLEIGVV